MPSQTKLLKYFNVVHNQKSKFYIVYITAKLLIGGRIEVCLYIITGHTVQCSSEHCTENTARGNYVLSGCMYSKGLWDEEPIEDMDDTDDVCSCDGVDGLALAMRSTNAE